MKKARCIIIVLVNCFILFGCHKSTTTEPSSIETGRDIGTENSSVSKSGELKIITAMPIGTNTVTASDAGYYTIESDGNNGCNVVYLDYNSMQQIYLSNQVNPAMDDTNSGWINVSNVYPVAYGDKLYLFDTGDIYAQPAENARIIVMRQNGDARTEIYLPSNMTFETNSYIAADDGAVYFMAKEYSLDSGDEIRRIIFRVDMESNALKEVMSFDSRVSQYAISGVNEDRLIMEVAETPDNPRDLESLQNITWHFKSLSLFDQSEETLASYKVGEVIGMTDRKTSFYYRKPNENTIFKHDLLTGEITTVLDVAAAVPDSIEDWWIYNIIDGNVMILLESNEIDTARKNAYVDGEKGTLNILPFGYAFNRSTEPMFIYEQSSTHYLLMSGVKEYYKSGEAVDGGLIDARTFFYTYSLINKEDYWNGRDSIQEFHDNIHPSDATAVLGEQEEQWTYQH